jgi:hypothetical protein
VTGGATPLACGRPNTNGLPCANRVARACDACRFHGGKNSKGSPMSTITIKVEGSQIENHDIRIGGVYVRAEREVRQAEADLRAYVDTRGGDAAQVVAQGINEHVARIGAARAALAAWEDNLRQAAADAQEYEAEVSRAEERHKRTLRRIARKYGRYA